MNQKKTNLNYINYNNNYSEVKFIQQIKEIYNLSTITKYNPIYKLFKKNIQMVHLIINIQYLKL